MHISSHPNMSNENQSHFEYTGRGAPKEQELDLSEKRGLWTPGTNCPGHCAFPSVGGQWVSDEWPNSRVLRDAGQVPPRPPPWPRNPARQAAAQVLSSARVCPGATQGGSIPACTGPGPEEPKEGPLPVSVHLRKTQPHFSSGEIRAEEEKDDSLL